MPTKPMSEVVQHLRRAVLLQDGAGLTDGQLLERFIEHRDEAAFAALVKRHGPMVWGLCRRVLPNYHDAEDAFQGTFLVLVRKGASIASPDLLPDWLYGVAHKTAIKARTRAAKRKERERQVAEMPEPAVSENQLWHELQPVLDEELSRLSAKYRAVVVLCDLEGKTRTEAARQLGVPEGTVAGWLARARGMLAKRLARRGLVVSSGSLAVVVSQNAGSASVPPSLLVSTIKAACLDAAGQAAAAGLISVEVAIITEGVLTAMFLSKVKVAGVVLLIAIGALLSTGTLVLSVSPAKEKDDPEKNAVPVAPAPQEMRGEATASAVASAYNLNDALGDVKFAGKRVKVTGVWYSVRRETNYPGPDPNYVLTMVYSSNTRLTFRFVTTDPKKVGDGPNSQKQLAELKGEEVLTIEGRCEGRIAEGELRGVIRFNDCKIISVKPPPTRPERQSTFGSKD